MVVYIALEWLKKKLLVEAVQIISDWSENISFLEVDTWGQPKIEPVCGI